ncbi:MAG: multidrug effflux MFS transporter [Microvirga sp.]
MSPNPMHGRDISRPEFIALIAAFMMLNALAIDVMLPALPQMAHSLHVTHENDRHWVILAYTLGLGVAQLAFGPLSDRFGRRIPMFAGVAIYAAASLAAILTPSWGVLIALRLVQGIGGASTRVISMSIVRDRYAGRAMAEVMSLIFMVFLVIPIVAPSIGQIIMLAGPWQMIFAVMGVMAVLTMAWGHFRLPETLARADRRPLTIQDTAAAFRIVVTSRSAFMYGLAGMFMFACIMMFIPASQQIYVDVYELGPWFPVAFGGTAALMAIGSFINARVVARFGMRRISHFAILVFSALGAVWLVCAMAGAVPFLVFFPIMAVCMFMFGWASSNMNALSMEPLGAVAGTASSVFGFIQTVGGVLIGGYLGSFYDGTTLPLAAGFLAMGIAALICILVAEKGRLFGVGAEYAQSGISHQAEH